jgi:hypothetical protein
MASSSERLPFRIPRSAFDKTLDILGERLKNTVIHDLELNAAYNASSENLELARVAEALQRLFGYEAAQLIMERVLLEMDRLCSAKASTA